VMVVNPICGNRDARGMDECIGGKQRMADWRWMNGRVNNVLVSFLCGFFRAENWMGKEMAGRRIDKKKFFRRASVPWPARIARKKARAN
jgi:hypothetical protein